MGRKRGKQGDKSNERVREACSQQAMEASKREKQSEKANRQVKMQIRHAGIAGGNPGAEQKGKKKLQIQESKGRKEEGLTC